MLDVGRLVVLDMAFDVDVDVDVVYADVDVLDVVVSVGGVMVLDVEAKEANGRQPSLRGLLSR